MVGDKPSARQHQQFEKWRHILEAVLSVTKAGATSGDLARAAIAANSGNKPWLPHFYLGHGIGTYPAEPPMIGTDLGEEYDDNFVFPVGMVLVLEPVVWEDGTGGYRSEEIVVITETATPHFRLPVLAVWRLRFRRTVQRYGWVAVNERWRRWQPTISTSWSSGDRPTSDISLAHRNSGSRGRGRTAQFASVVRATGEIYLNSTADEGIPEEIGHDHLYGLAWNPMTLIGVLKNIQGASARPAGRNRRALTDFRQAAADGLPERRTRRRRNRDAHSAAGQDTRRAGRDGRRAACRRSRSRRRRRGVAARPVRADIGGCSAGGDGRGRGEHAGYPGRSLGDLARTPLASRTR